jgi:hypothetical protein
MRPSFSHFVVALAATPLLLLAPPAALAGPGGGGGSSGAEACNNIALVLNSESTCQYIVSGCTANCTPPNLVAACSGECTAAPDVSCTGGCESDCEAKCMVDPPTFDCTGSCEEGCTADCMDNCAGDTACQNDCGNTCTNQCEYSCTGTPGTADCTAKCQTSCNASCTVEANINCHEMCSVSLEGGCNVACSQPTGALFCDGQYVDLTNDPAACLAYLAAQGFSVNVNCSLNASGSTCNLSNGLGCSAASPGVGSRDPLGVAGIAGMMIGLGLVASRRRRRS